MPRPLAASERASLSPAEPVSVNAPPLAAGGLTERG